MPSFLRHIYQVPGLFLPWLERHFVSLSTVSVMYPEHFQCFQTKLHNRDPLPARNRNRDSSTDKQTSKIEPKKKENQTNGLLMGRQIIIGYRRRLSEEWLGILHLASPSRSLFSVFPGLPKVNYSYNGMLLSERSWIYDVRTLSFPDHRKLPLVSFPRLLTSHPPPPRPSYRPIYPLLACIVMNSIFYDVNE